MLDTYEGLAQTGVSIQRGANRNFPERLNGLIVRYNAIASAEKVAQFHGLMDILTLTRGFDAERNASGANVSDGEAAWDVWYRETFTPQFYSRLREAGVAYPSEWSAIFREMALFSEAAHLPDVAYLLARVHTLMPASPALSAVLRSFVAMESKWPEAVMVQRFFLLRETRQRLRETLLSASCTPAHHTFIETLLEALSARFLQIAQKIPLREEFEPPSHPFALSVAHAAPEKLWEAARSLYEAPDTRAAGEAFLAVIAPEATHERLTVECHDGHKTLTLVDNGAVFIFTIGAGIHPYRGLPDRLRAGGQEALFASELFSGNRWIDGEHWTFALSWHPATKPLQSPVELKLRLFSGIEIHEQLIAAARVATAANIVIPFADTALFEMTSNGRIIMVRPHALRAIDGTLNNTLTGMHGVVHLPPEWQVESTRVTLDSLHGWWLGISMHAWLTGTPAAAFCGPQPDKLSPFSAYNDELPEILEDILSENPEHRLTLKGIQGELRKLGHGLREASSPFHYRPEAYLYALNQLEGLTQTSSHPVLIESIAAIRALFENHTQDLGHLKEILEHAARETGRVELSETADAVRRCDFRQSIQARWPNPLARLYESHQCITLLTNPTRAMMKAVAAVSQGMLVTLRWLKASKSFKHVQEYLKLLSPPQTEPIRFGAFREQVSWKKFERLLEDNAPESLVYIMHAHFVFARHFLRSLPRETPFPVIREPEARFAKVAAKYRKGLYRERLLSLFESKEVGRFADWLSQRCEYSEIMTAEPARGRAGVSMREATTRMGIMMDYQSEYAEHLPGLDVAWEPDVLNQGADIRSDWVRFLTYSDAVYVSGPSSMLYMLLGLMEIHANFETLAQKQHYLATVCGYLVSGGLHSLHEALAPAEYLFGLVPGYPVYIPGGRAPQIPPAFQVFWQQQMHIDPEMHLRYEAGWSELLRQYREHQHAHLHYPPERDDAMMILSRILTNTVPDSKRPGYRERFSRAVTDATLLCLQALNVFSMDSPCFFTPQTPSLSHIASLLQLPAKVCRQETLAEAAGAVGAWFENEAISVLERMFIGHLLDILKRCPVVVEALNRQSTSLTLMLVREQHYSLEEAADFCEDAILFFRAFMPAFSKAEAQKVSLSS
ncbi:hypothetical protein E3226_009495 [Legionella geestiana]|uniref:hypothetical protein n=1 Tax=Legionella geestiana TaxID=45065 RepID=UPI001092C763|nr:hypothetical protein [Legionella geestiana]QDQ40608.1 hypothetical protein E3226_009495 [Legionella geestiana]